MTIDERGRSAGARLRSLHEADAHLSDRLPDLLERARRRRLTRAALASAAAVVLLGGAGMVLLGTPSDQTKQPSDAPTVSQTAPAGVCQQPFMHCAADGRLTMDFAVPVTWRPIGDFNHHLTYITDGNSHLFLVGSYRTNLDRASGVTIGEGVRAVTTDRLAQIDRSVPGGAQALAQWLAGRGFLDASTVRHTTLDGRDAWTVQVHEKQRQSYVATCNSATVRCMPLLAPAAQPGIVLGSYPGMVARYTFVDLPGSGTAVVWSWDFLGGRTLDRNQAIVDTISFADR